VTVTHGVVTLAMMALAVATSGCTLIHDDVPFQISVINDQDADWAGVVVVVDDAGHERFRRALTVSEHSISLTIDIPPLVGDFRFIAESGGSRWEATASSAEGPYSWAVVVDAAGVVCFDLHLAAPRTVCPEPRAS
jgi:hypothetical protein